MKKQAVVGSALVVIGVAAGSLLAPQAAWALDFTFSFEGVTGLIEGLSEGTNACLSTDSCRITVTNNGGNGAPVGPSHPYLGLDVYEATLNGLSGFEVVTPTGGNPYILQTSASWPPPVKGLIWYGSNNLYADIFKLAFLPGYDQASNTYYPAGCLVNADSECAYAYENQPYRATKFTYVTGSAPGGGTDVLRG